MINLHSHTEFCDGRASMAKMAQAAFEAGFKIWGISPHSPVCCPSGANMNEDDMEAFLSEANRLKQKFASQMHILTGMEIDYISEDFGPHTSFFQSIPLDYRIGSVHFVRTKDGKPVDVDGRAERFLGYLQSEYEGDLRYVVETYFNMELEMLDKGGFDIIGHLDKIGDNGSHAQTDLEVQPWYGIMVEKVISKAAEKDIIIEINTKKYEAGKRFFPNERWWPLLKKHRARLVISTDAHYPDKTDSGYNAAFQRLKEEGLVDQLEIHWN